MFLENYPMVGFPGRGRELDFQTTGMVVDGQTGVTLEPIIGQLFPSDVNCSNCFSCCCWTGATNY